MVLDDDPTTRRFLRDVLEKLFQHRVTEAANVKQGLSQVRVSCPDMILLDQHLPDGTAVDFCQLLSQMQAPKDVPKWLITGEKPLAWDSGFWERFNVRGFMVKPFPIELIDDVIHRCLPEFVA